MATPSNTHYYDGKLRKMWFEMRPMLIEKYLPNCLSFDNTIEEIEQWLNRKYFNVKRIGRARRALRILRSYRRSNFDVRNDINVEELLPILWIKVKDQEDIHNTFYEQLCDITGGSCSQGRSTRLFQFLFLFDLPSEILNTRSENENEQSEISDEQGPREDNLSETSFGTESTQRSEEKQIQENLELNEEHSSEREELRQSHTEKDLIEEQQGE